MRLIKLPLGSVLAGVGQYIRPIRCYTPLIGRVVDGNTADRYVHHMISCSRILPCPCDFIAVNEATLLLCCKYTNTATAVYSVKT